MTGSAVVTGAANGTGRAVAARLQAAGWDVALTDIDPSVSEALARGPGRRGFASVFDLASVPAIRAFFDEVRDRFGALDALVNCAGVRTAVPMLKLTEEAWDHSFAIDVRAPFFCAQAAVPLMIAAGGGRIVNVGSISATKGFVNRASYGSAKAALHGLTRHLAAELAPAGIAVNTVSPGFVAGTVMTGMYNDATVAAMMRVLPPGSERSTVDDIAALIVYFATQCPRTVTGVTVPIDSGLDALLTIDAAPWATDPDLLRGYSQHGDLRNGGGPRPGGGSSTAN